MVPIMHNEQKTFVFLHAAPWPYLLPLSIPRQEANSKHGSPPAAFNRPHPGPILEIWGPSRAYYSPLSIMALLGQSHVRHHLHHKKGQVSHRIQFPTAAPWQPFQVSIPFTGSLWSNLNTRTRDTQPGKRGCCKNGQSLKTRLCSLCIPHPESHSSEDSNINGHLKSFLENACLHPFSLPST